MNSVQAHLMRKLPRDSIEVMSFSKCTTGTPVHSKVYDFVKSCTWNRLQSTLELKGCVLAELSIWTVGQQRLERDLIRALVNAVQAKEASLQGRWMCRARCLL
jgi:hypothetical protein